jgi:hypothetical protein
MNKPDKGWEPVFMRPKPSKTTVVALYRVDRAYGGPEEGGWWFDTGELLRIVRVVKDREKAYAIARRYNDFMRSFRKRYRVPEPDSVICTGVVEARVFSSNEVPTHFPQVTPQYE